MYKSVRYSYYWVLMGFIELVGNKLWMQTPWDEMRTMEHFDGNWPITQPFYHIDVDIHL